MVDPGLVQVTVQAGRLAEHMEGGDDPFGVTDQLLQGQRFGSSGHCGRRVASGDGDLRHLRQGDAQDVAVAGPAGVLDAGGGDRLRRGVVEVEESAGEEHVAHRQPPTVVQLVEQRDRLTVGVE